MLKGKGKTGQTTVAVESVFPNASSSTNVEGSKPVYDDDECGSSNKSWIGQRRHWRKTSPCQLGVLSIKRHALLRHDYSSYLNLLSSCLLFALVSIFDWLIFNLVSLANLCPIFDWLILALDSSVGPTYFTRTKVFDTVWENLAFLKQCSDSLRSIFRKKLVQYRFSSEGEGRKEVMP